MKIYAKYAEMLRRCMIAAAGVSVALGAMAVPAKREPFEIVQPDGSRLTVTLRGDERSHCLMTSDGYLLTETDGGRYEYASLAADGTLQATGVTAREAARRTATDRAVMTQYTPAIADRMLEARVAASSAYTARKTPMRGPGLYDGVKFPSKGEQKAIVVLVEFTDLAFGSKNDPEFSNIDPHTYFTEMLNKEGFNTYGGTGSCRDWFIDNSKGQFTPQFDLFGPVKLSKGSSYYGRNDAYGNDMHADEMVLEACRMLDGEVDFSQYDRDGDGEVDNVYVFYAGFGEADGGASTTVWPHSWDLSEAGIAKAERTFDGVVVNKYGCSNETDFTAKRPDGIGTFVHEFSHVLGLPDLYATNSSSAFTPGEYSVLDYGPYNNGGCTPPNYSAYERYALGWITPDLIEETGEYTLENLPESNRAVIVPTERTNEYFLLENRQQNGWDTYIPGHGMLVWHIDYNKNIFTANTVNNRATHQYVDLVEADNRQTNASRNGDTFPGSAKVTEFSFDSRPSLRSWGGRDLGVAFSNISEVYPEDEEQSARITFHADVTRKPESGVTEIDEADVPAEYYSLQGVRLAQPREGDLVICRKGARAVKMIYGK